MGLYRPK